MSEMHPLAAITGGTRGIGLDIGRRLAADGWDLFLLYKSDAQQAQDAQEELGALGAKVWLHAADTRDPATARALAKAIKAGPDRVDLLVHNAAFGTMGSVRRIGSRSWNATFETNVTALLGLSQKLLPWLANSKGSIIAISSIGAQVCYNQYAAMGCSKAAMEALIRYLAFELASDGIRCNSVSGGPMETRALGSFKDPDSVRNYARGMGPFERMGEPKDLSGVVRFLVAREASWITGQNIVVDGGITLGVDFNDWTQARAPSGATE